MSPRSKPLQVSFTASERDLIRREMGVHFSQYPSLADGIFRRARPHHDAPGRFLGPLRGDAEPRAG